MPPLPPHTNRAVPGLSSWSWDAIRAHLVLLAANPASEAMVEHLVEGLRQQSVYLTPELIRREIAMIYAAVVDPSFPEEGQTMT